MKKNSGHATKQKPEIHCVEVMVSNHSMQQSGQNLHWTLSVYSLENKPVKSNLLESDSPVFHFMLYDWNRTIKQLLDDLHVPYSIIQFFRRDSLLSALPDQSATYYDMKDNPSGDSEIRHEEDADLVVDDGHI